MTKQRIPLVGSEYHRNWDDADVLPAISGIDQRFVNVIFKAAKNPAFGNQKVWACKRPGIDTGTAISNVQTGALAVVNAPVGTNPQYSLWPSTTVNNLRFAFGTSSDSNINITFVPSYTSRLLYYSNPAESIVFWVADGSGSQRAYVYAGFGGGASQIVDADFPASTIIGNFVEKDGYLFILTSTGQIWNSDLASKTSWTASSYLTVQSNDYGSTLARYKNNIVAFCNSNIEFYENVGNPTGSPLQLIGAATIKGYGIAWAYGGSSFATGNHVFEARNTLFWINNSNLESGPGIYTLDGFSPKKISTPDVDFDLGRVDGNKLSIAGIFEVFGYNYLVISTGDQSTDYAWVYCFETGIWVIWTSTLFSALPFIGNNGNNSSNNREVVVFSGTKLYKMDVASMLYSDMDFTDNGSPFTMTIQTGVWDGGTMNDKRMNRLSIVGSQTRTTSPTNISFSDDDYQSFNTPRPVDMMTDYPQLVRCGPPFRRRAIRITNAANTPFQAEAIEMDIDVLSQ